MTERLEKLTEYSKYPTLNRLYATSLIGTFGIMAAYGGHPFFYAMAVPAVIEGVGDLVTGKHHYLSVKLWNFLRKPSE